MPTASSSNKRRLRDPARRHVARRRRVDLGGSLRIDAKPRSILMNRIRPDEIHFERSTNHHRQFLECVKTRRRTLSPADVALRSATPGYLGLISILTNTKIQWDPERQRILNNPAAERLLWRPMRGPWHL